MEVGRISSVGKAISAPSRAAILAVLCGGAARTGGQLAAHIGRSASTTSKHLSELIDAGLVLAEANGRHRYFRIAGEEVALLLEQIEQLNLVERNPQRRPPQSSPLAVARSCYDHLAGQLGVGIYQSLHSDGSIERAVDGVTTVTEKGHERLQSFGINTVDLSKRQRPLARSCLDWTQRTHHLGGSLGAALLTKMMDERWIRRGKDPRVIIITDAGHRPLKTHFAMAKL